MRDKFLFSDAQDLTGLNSTGVVSSNIWDIEEDAVTDGMLMGWLNLSFAAGNAGATEGLWIELRTSDNTNITTTPKWLCAIKLTDAELTAMAGKTVSIGFYKAELQKYVGVFYRADTTSLAGTATGVDAWFSEHPIGELAVQKKPTS